MERTYTIPLRKAFLKAPTYSRTNRAVSEVRKYLERHTKSNQVLLGEELNRALWARGDSKPPAKVTVFVKKEDDKVYAELAGRDFKKKDFSQKEETAKPKAEKRGLEAADEPAGQQETVKIPAAKTATKKAASKKAAKK
jgi:large subunit ribosomal protein L31e